MDILVLRLFIKKLFNILPKEQITFIEQESKKVVEYFERPLWSNRWEDKEYCIIYQIDCVNRYNDIREMFPEKYYDQDIFDLINYEEHIVVPLTEEKIKSYLEQLHGGYIYYDIFNSSLIDLSQESVDWALESIPNGEPYFGHDNEIKAMYRRLKPYGINLYDALGSPDDYLYQLCDNLNSL